MVLQGVLHYQRNGVGQNAFDVGLLEGNRGFDSSRALWKDAGWREIRDIRKMLEVSPWPFPPHNLAVELLIEVVL
jgi:hypothetical protein